jgi:predicted DNA-binding transcriptional regulator YafY
VKQKYVSDTPSANPFALSDGAFKVLHGLRALGGHPTFKSLAELTGKSEPTLYRHFAELVDAGFPVALSPAKAGSLQRKTKRGFAQ